MAPVGEDKEDKQYRCQICQKSYSRGCDLKMHNRTHTGEKPYKCELCQASFSRVSDLNRHTRTHTGEKPYKCQLCQVSFSDGGNLKKHTRTHTGEKPYKCQLCQASFSQSYYLKRHTITHTDEKPYKCQLCQASFSRGSDLNKHRGTHSRKKPHTCHSCNKSFSHNIALKSHLQRHTSEKPCQNCNKGFNGLVYRKNHKRSHMFQDQHSCRKPYRKCSSSTKQIKLYAEKVPTDLNIKSEEILKSSDQLLTFGVENVLDKATERFLRNTHNKTDELTNPAKVKGGECLSIKKITSPKDAGPILDKCYGCGVCGEILDTEGDFIDHCSSHRFSPPDDLFTDLLNRLEIKPWI